jgi:hypothetical protein
MPAEHNHPTTLPFENTHWSRINIDVWAARGLSCTEAVTIRYESLPMTAPQAERHRVVFLFDVDNTLLDNDQIVNDLRSHLEHEFGLEQSECYWRLFEARRQEIGYADYLDALQQYRLEYPHHPRILKMSSFLIDYPFADRLYPKALEVIHHLRHAGPCVVLSDGDVVFQPRKVERSGILEAVNGQALIYIHKEHELEDVMRRFLHARVIMRSIRNRSSCTQWRTSRLNASLICSSMTQDRLARNSVLLLEVVKWCNSRFWVQQKSEITSRSPMPGTPLLK